MQRGIESFNTTQNNAKRQQASFVLPAILDSEIVNVISSYGYENRLSFCFFTESL